MRVTAAGRPMPLSGVREWEQLGQGRENAKNFLSSNPEIMVEISDRVLVAAGLKPGEEEPLVDEGFAAADEEPIEID